MDLEKIKRIGISAAFKGADVLKKYFGRLSESEIYKKGSIDLVTEADIQCEKAIIQNIKGKCPEHSFLAEESGLGEGSSPLKWIIDPLDGTTNFAHSLGLFSISIAFAEHQEILAGIVLNPVTGELFTAIKGKGSSLNERAIYVSNKNKVSESLLVTGFPYNFKEQMPYIMTRFSNCLKASQGVRRLGSAALDLCFVACGRFEGFWEQNLKPWDTAAGLLIAKEAGATVTDFSDQAFTIEKKEILATNGNIHKEMIKLLELPVCAPKG